MKKIARGRGGECLSSEYINNSTPLEWKCSDGHVWEARPANVINGNWCHYCGFYQTENKCRFIFERLLGNRFPKKRNILSGKYEL
ncbi:hypothetical protein R0J91_14635, partial [Micrococcus sp. SIMBA_131]